MPTFSPRAHISEGPHGLYSIDFYTNEIVLPLTQETFDFTSKRRVVSIQNARGTEVVDAFLADGADAEVAGRWLMDMVVIRGSHGSSD